MQSFYATAIPHTFIFIYISISNNNKLFARENLNYLHKKGEFSSLLLEMPNKYLYLICEKFSMTLH
jgi:hypothetical protein